MDEEELCMEIVVLQLTVQEMFGHHDEMTPEMRAAVASNITELEEAWGISLKNDYEYSFNPQAKQDTE